MRVGRMSAEDSLATVLLRIFRSSKYRTQAALAKDLKVTAGAVSNYFREKNGRVPDEQSLRRIAELCSNSQKEREGYEQAMMRALLREKYPMMLVSVASPISLPPLQFSLAFRNQVRQDLAKFSVRRCRARIEQEGVSWRLVQQMLDGRRVLTRPQVMALAKALGADVETYLSIMCSPTDPSGRLASSERELLAGLTSLPKASRKDIESVQRQVHGGPRPRRRPKAGQASPQKPLRRGR